MNDIKLPVTRKQKQVLRFIIETIRKKGYPPTTYEIKDNLKIKNVGTIYSHLTGLEKKGYITKIKNQERGIRLTELSDGLSPKQVNNLKEKGNG